MRKCCSKCGKDKPLLEFYRCKGGKFGVRSWCKECDKTSTQKWLADNPDKIAEYKGGKDKLFGFFVGQVMRASQGKANPK
ncbi:hypothetical protein LCGC14_2908840, partial [marine sediment metagenome]